MKSGRNIGVRDCPYGICCPWVRGGWDLDALGEFFRRRRRRRRRPRPLLFRQILETIVISNIFHENVILGHLLFRRSFFLSYFRIMSNPLHKAIYSSRNKSQMAPKEKVLFHEQLGLRSNTPGKSHVFDRESAVFKETMKERGPIDEHFAFCG